MTNRPHTILISPLNWGLGHATRMLPVISFLKDEGHQLIISSYGESHDFLKIEFPSLIHEYHPGIQVTYPVSGSMAWHMTKQLPAILSQLKKETAITDELVRKYNPQLILSDNRYHVRSSSAYSIFITHQTNILSPIFSRIINRLNHHKINSFDECWIPDDDDSTFSGSLSSTKGITIPVFKTGILSTLEKNTAEKLFDYCFVISGPDPQRKILAENVNRLLPSLRDKKVVIVTSLDFPFTSYSHHTLLIRGRREHVSRMISASRVVVGRSGYSTIMDLAGSGCKALLIPTPGQTEQEYLARSLAAKNICALTDQAYLTLEALASVDRTNGFTGYCRKDGFRTHLLRVLSLFQGE